MTYQVCGLRLTSWSGCGLSPQRRYKMPSDKFAAQGCFPPLLWPLPPWVLIEWPNSTPNTCRHLPKVVNRANGCASTRLFAHTTGTPWKQVNALGCCAPTGNSARNSPTYGLTPFLHSDSMTGNGY